MKTKDFKDLRVKDLKSLAKMADQKRMEHAKKLTEIASGKEKNLKAALNLRRETAKILTLIREKEIVEKLEGLEKGGKDRRGTAGASSEK